MSSQNFEQVLLSLPFKKLQIEEEKEDVAPNFDDNEPEFLQQPSALIIPFNVPNGEEATSPVTATFKPTEN